MKITIYILTFNHEEFIAECLNSALAQTYLGEVEILIWDNCSTDNTVATIEGVLSNYSGNYEVRLIKADRNYYPSFHMTNSVLKISSGELIVLLGGDDYMSTDRLVKLIDAFNTSTPSVIASSVNVVDQDSNFIEEINRLTVKTGFKRYSDSRDFLLRGGSPVCIGSSLAFHRDVYDKFGPFREGPRNIDVIVPFRGGLLNGNLYLEEALVSRRVHDKNIALSEIERKTSDLTEKLVIKERKMVNRLANHMVMRDDFLHLQSKNSVREEDRDIQQLLDKKILAISRRWLGVRHELMTRNIGIV